MKHNNDFAYDLEFGQEGESQFAEIVNNKKVEVKRDRVAHKTGNLFIEYESRGKPSGIATSQADTYAYWIGEACLVISSERLKHICRNYIGTEFDILGGDNNTSKGILLPIESILMEKIYFGNGWSDDYGMNISINIKQIQEALESGKLEMNSYGDIKLRIGKRMTPHEKSKATHFICNQKPKDLPF